MASVRSKVFNTLTRLMMGALFLRERSPLWFREKADAVERRATLKLPLNVRVEESESPPGRWLHWCGEANSAGLFGRPTHVDNAASDTAPPSYQDNPLPGRTVVLYLHGGAFVMRMPSSHGAMVGAICARAKVSAFMPWYRLAPEHPFPAAPEDCLGAYRYLLELGYRSNNIVVMGDSAGGNLALALLHQIKQAELPMPGAAVLLSPVLDMAQISASWSLHTSSDPMYVVQRIVNPVEHYLPAGADLFHPHISPCYGDFSNFPPILTLVGSIECLLDDSVSLVKKALESGVEAQVHVWQGMPHVFPLQAFLPEAPLALDELCQWLFTCTKTPSGRPYDGAVRVYQRRPFGGVLRQFTNNKYLHKALQE